MASPDPGGRRHAEGGALGEEAPAGRRAVRQDAGRPRPGPHRRRGRPPGPGLSHAGDRLRSLSSRARRPSASAWRRWSSTTCWRAATSSPSTPPLTGDTRHLLGEAELARTKPGVRAHQPRARRHHRGAGAWFARCRAVTWRAPRSTCSSRSRRRPTIRCCASSRSWSRRHLGAATDEAQTAGGPAIADQVADARRARRGGQRRSTCAGRWTPRRSKSRRRTARARRSHGRFPRPDGRGPHGGGGSSTPATIDGPADRQASRSLPARPAPARSSRPRHRSVNAMLIAKSARACG